MKTQDKYLNEKVISLKGYEKAKKENQKKSAEKLNMKIDFLMDKVINTSNQFRNGLVTVEEYKRFLKDMIKKL